MGSVEAYNPWHSVDTSSVAYRHQLVALELAPNTIEVVKAAMQGGRSDQSLCRPTQFTGPDDQPLGSDQTETDAGELRVCD